MTRSEIAAAHAETSENAVTRAELTRPRAQLAIEDELTARRHAEHAIRFALPKLEDIIERLGVACEHELADEVRDVAYDLRCSLDGGV